MRKRPTLIVCLAVVAATAIAASVAVAGEIVTGSDGNTQSLEVVASPKKLSKTVLTPATLNVTAKTATTTAANGIPSPSVHAVVDFDKNMKLFTKGVPTCDPSKLQATSTEVAETVCGKAKIGSGQGSAALPSGSGKAYVEPTVITAYNGIPKGGKPVVLLHAYGVAPVQSTTVLVGTVSNYNKEGYGPRLDVEIPPLAGGSGAILEFQVKINKKFSYKGKKQSYVSAKCTSKKLKARGAFTYKDGVTLTALSTQACTPKK